MIFCLCQFLVNSYRGGLSTEHSSRVNGTLVSDQEESLSINVTLMTPTLNLRHQPHTHDTILPHDYGELSQVAAGVGWRWGETLPAWSSDAPPGRLVGVCDKLDNNMVYRRRLLQWWVQFAAQTRLMQFSTRWSPKTNGVYGSTRWHVGPKGMGTLGYSKDDMPGSIACITLC